MMFGEINFFRAIIKINMFRISSQRGAREILLKKITKLSA